MDIPSFSLESKAAIVVGGKRGIGKAIALGFAKAGADVAVCSRALEDGQLRAVADEIQGLGRRSLAVQADITRSADVDHLVQRVTDEFGVIDILVNSAGVVIRAPLLELREDDWDETIDTDLKGCYLCCKVVGRRMVEQRRGNIINIASSLTTLTTKAVPQMGVYSVAKAGVLMLTRVLAVELASHNIRVNAISPGLTRTEMSDWVSRNPEILKEMVAGRPLGRIAEPADMIGAAIFLASDASSYITGHTILVDGGFSA